MGNECQGNLDTSYTVTIPAPRHQHCMISYRFFYSYCAHASCALINSHVCHVYITAVHLWLGLPLRAADGAMNGYSLSSQMSLAAAALL
ncbi:MAG: hypothetical protein OJF51_001226 [Nitrospira sp.]|jgi:hypothetical protein|nr:MAG: hypothetical protein OJF51_001226 [Nitrospira sp.]